MVGEPAEGVQERVCNRVGIVNGVLTLGAGILPTKGRAGVLSLRKVGGHVLRRRVVPCV